MQLLHMRYTKLKQTATCHSLRTGGVLQTGWISAPPLIMFFCGNTAQIKKIYISITCYHFDLRCYNNLKNYNYICIWTDRRSVATCVPLWYCSERSGMTAAVMMWPALLEALHAACSSLALGHTSFRSGSLRWCLQSGTTLHFLNFRHVDVTNLFAFRLHSSRKLSH